MVATKVVAPTQAQRAVAVDAIQRIENTKLVDLVQSPDVSREVNFVLKFSFLVLFSFSHPSLRSCLFFCVRRSRCSSKYSSANNDTIRTWYLSHAGSSVDGPRRYVTPDSQSRIHTRSSAYLHPRACTSRVCGVRDIRMYRTAVSYRSKYVRTVLLSPLLSSFRYSSSTKQRHDRTRYSSHTCITAVGPRRYLTLALPH